jgi:hypothetical protein
MREIRVILPLRSGTAVLSDRIGIVQPSVLLEFAVRTVNSVLAHLSTIGRILVATRQFVQTQLYRCS